MNNTNNYAEALRAKVCTQCIFRTSLQSCEREGECPVFFYLPEMIKVVHVIESELLSDYIAVLRPVICENCTESSEGLCFKRSEDDCPLDKYFTLVVEVLRDTNRKNTSFLSVL